MKLLNLFLIIGAVTLGVCGCDNPVANPNESDVSVSNNTVQLTRDQLMRLVDLRIKLAKMVSPKIQPTALEELRKDLLNHGVEKLKQDYVVKCFAQECGLEIPDERVAETLKSLLGGGKTAENKLTKLSLDEFTCALELVKSDLMLKEVHDYVIKDAKIMIAEDDVQRFKKQIVDYNERAAATNVLVYARATNCWEQVSSGKLTFDEAAKIYDESGDKTDGRAYWGEFPLSALEGETALCNWLLKLKPGGLTPPIECDNGLAVIQLVSINQNNENGQPFIPTAYYQLNRIFFELPIFYETPTEELVRTEMQRKREKEYFADFLEKQQSRYVFVGEITK